MAKFEDGTFVIISDMGKRFRDWKDKMVEKGFPDYIWERAEYHGGYYEEHTCEDYIYKVVSSFQRSTRNIEIVYHIESLLSSHIVKTDQTCHVLIGEGGLTEYINN